MIDTGKITSINSLKMLERSLKKAKINKDASNAKVDVENKYKSSGQKKLYPIVIYLDRTKIKGVEWQSPEMPHTLTKLQEYLRTQKL